MNGVLIVDKPAGFTSFDVTAKLRGVFHTKKIGHGGTLDPEATGVLPVFVGEATKLCDYLLCEEKCYEAGLRLGLRTDTDDIWGEILREEPVAVTEAEAKEAVLRFVGDLEQIPPMYSAKKVNGKKLYELARKGIEVERRPEKIRISDITVTDIKLPDVYFRVSCSKGTYIRSLCRDIGESLGVGGTMCYLRRVRHGRFTIEDAYTLGEIRRAADEGRLSDLLIPIPDLFDWPRIRVTEAGERRLLNGNPLTAEELTETPAEDHFLALDTAGEFRGIYREEPDSGLWKPEKMFLNH